MKLCLCAASPYCRGFVGIKQDSILKNVQLIRHMKKQTLCSKGLKKIVNSVPDKYSKYCKYSYDATFPTPRDPESSWL